MRGVVRRWIAQWALHLLVVSIAATDDSTRESDDPRRRALGSPRPLVVVKLPRTGSTWLASILNSSGLYCGFHAEASNFLRYREGGYERGKWLTQSECAQVNSTFEEILRCSGTQSDAMRSGMYGGFSLNPIKFGLVRSQCWPGTVRTLRKRRPAIWVLTRENAAAQAASELVSMSVSSQHLCATPWQLRLCPDMPMPHRVAPSPADFVARTLSVVSQTRMLLQYARQLVTPGDQLLHLIFEQLMDHAEGIGDFVAQLALGDRHVDTVASTRYVEPSLREKLANYDEIVAYVRQTNKTPQIEAWLMQGEVRRRHRRHL